MHPELATVGPHPRNGEHERLWWRGLALTRRDYLNGKEVVSSERYLNEPHATGGNPVLAWEGKAAPESAKERAKAPATRLLFNDMQGSTVAVLDGDKAQGTGMTLFGETPDGQGAGFFTGKPHVDELGYAFLFRNYRPEKAKWQTADPLGYPDGWNCLAYCNNIVGDYIDLYGALQREIGKYRYDWSWDEATLAELVFVDDYINGYAGEHIQLSWSVVVIYECIDQYCKAESKHWIFTYFTEKVEFQCAWFSRIEINIPAPNNGYSLVGELLAQLFGKNLFPDMDPKFIDKQAFEAAALKRPKGILKNPEQFFNNHMHIYE